ncbi:MAG: HDOD domain-containing protein [Nitrospiraceae bacterium]|nr:MAG: HDOD domain-containing protein [Nitrospiraceae bacterium]
MGESIQSELKRIKNLPTLPGIAREVLKIASDPLMSIDRLKDIVAQDPAICARILSIANSAFFGGMVRTSKLNDAIMRIGMKSVRDIAVGVSVLTLFTDKNKTSGYKRLFNHSMFVGLSARTLARSLKMSIAEDIMMDGLLHDLGLLVINKYFPESFKNILDKIAHAGSLLEAEKDILHHTHAEVGFWLADQWKLPATILDVTLFHHSPSLAKRNEKYIALVHIADYITTRHRFSSVEKEPHYPMDPVSFEMLGLSGKDMNYMEETICTVFQEQQDNIENARQGRG